MLNIKVLKALNGDSIIISYGDDRLHYILVDGGRGKLCFHQLCKFIDEIKEKKGKIDLLVLTHIDSDHIDGILRLFSNQDFDFSIIEQMWFNFGERLFNSLQIDGLYKKINLYERDTKISWRQGEDLEEILQRTGIIRKLPIVSPGCHFVGGAKLTVLSPSVEILKEFAPSPPVPTISSTSRSCSNLMQCALIPAAEAVISSIVSPFMERAVR